MSVRIKIPFILLRYTNRRDVFTVEGSTVGECFADLARECPKIKKAILNDAGKLMDIVPIFKNDDLSKQLKEDSPVEGGDELSIIFVGG